MTVSKFRPRWRLPFHAVSSRPVVQSAAFVAARKANGGITARPKCHGKRHSDGQPCQAAALRGSKYCRHHGGLIGAWKAEEARSGRPVIIVRKPRKISLGQRGATESWPEGLPKLPRFLNLGPYQRGRLFEAWENRLTAADVWQNELDMPRYRSEKP